MFVHQAGRALGGFDLGVFFLDVQQFLLAFGAESECEKGASLLLSRLSGREKERGKKAERVSKAPGGWCKRPSPSSLMKCPEKPASGYMHRESLLG
jgi:hypothetical protein